MRYRAHDNLEIDHVSVHISSVSVLKPVSTSVYRQYISHTFVPCSRKFFCCKDAFRSVDPLTKACILATASVHECFPPMFSVPFEFCVEISTFLCLADTERLEWINSCSTGFRISRRSLSGSSESLISCARAYTCSKRCSTGFIAKEGKFGRLKIE